MINEVDFFQSELLIWYKDNTRLLPWKNTKDPYSIWLSEIILQQTRVIQGTPYFHKFINEFPTVKDLALADLDHVLRLWEGLGYYSRARNLHFTAKYIYYELNGNFPEDYQSLLKLKGVGPYTAAAISSFAYDLVHPVVDGNVIRLLTRYFGINQSVDDTAVKKQINELALKCISHKQPAIYNQAIMDFGSIICSPKLANCESCPLKSKCQAFQYDLVYSIPKKTKKIKKRHRYFHFFIVSYGETSILEKRIGKDIWQELYQFPMLEELDKKELSRENVISFLDSFGISKFKYNFRDDTWHKQVLTHQNINARFYHIEVKDAFIIKSAPYYLVKKKNWKNFAFPRIINHYLNTKKIGYDQ